MKDTFQAFAELAFDVFDSLQTTYRVERPVANTSTSPFGATSTWTSLGDEKGVIHDATPREVEHWQQIGHEVTHIISIEGQSNAKTQDRLVIGNNRALRVWGVDNPGGLDAVTYLACEEIDAIVTGQAPVFSSGSIGNVDDRTVVLTFDEDIESPTNDYKTGFVIKVAGSAVTITSGTRQADESVIYFVIPEVTLEQAVTISYTEAGDIRAQDDEVELAAFTEAVSNLIGTHLWFDEPDNSGHIPQLAGV